MRGGESGVIQEAENISQKGQRPLEYVLEFKPDEFSA